MADHKDTVNLCPDDVYRLYQNEFLKIYGDLVIVTAQKPVQIISQLEAAFTHMAVATLNNDHAQENFHAALKHIQRASLDSAKMLWLAYKDRLDAIISDSNLRKFCINCPEDELVKAYNKAEKLAEQARICELNHVGIDPTKSLELYHEASIALREVFEKVDKDKLNNFKTFHLIYKLKEYSIGFLLGIAASVIASYIWAVLMGN